jgi:hypothetical protein
VLVYSIHFLQYSVKNWRGLMASTTMGMKLWLAPHLRRKSTCGQLA